MHDLKKAPVKLVYLFGIKITRIFLLYTKEFANYPQEFDDLLSKYEELLRANQDGSEEQMQLFREAVLRFSEAEQVYRKTKLHSDDLISEIALLLGAISSMNKIEQEDVISGARVGATSTRALMDTLQDGCDFFSGNISPIEASLTPKLPFTNIYSIFWDEYFETLWTFK